MDRYLIEAFQMKPNGLTAQDVYAAALGRLHERTLTLESSFTENGWGVVMVYLTVEVPGEGELQDIAHRMENGGSAQVSVQRVK